MRQEDPVGSSQEDGNDVQLFGGVEAIPIDYDGTVVVLAPGNSGSPASVGKEGWSGQACLSDICLGPEDPLGLP